jgi:hypothetical protein
MRNADGAGWAELAYRWRCPLSPNFGAEQIMAMPAHRALRRRWTPVDERPELVAEQLAWHPTGAAQPFVLDLVAFFADIAAEE